jgi:Fic/DOC family
MATDTDRLGTTKTGWRFRRVGRPSTGVLDYATAGAAIAERELMIRNEAAPLFANQRGESPCRESGVPSSRSCSARRWIARATRRLRVCSYFVIEDHPFSDGNKRIGSFLFMLNLKQEKPGGIGRRHRVPR